MIPYLVKNSDIGNDLAPNNSYKYPRLVLDTCSSCIVTRYGKIGWDAELTLYDDGDHVPGIMNSIAKRDIIFISIGTPTTIGNFPIEPFRISRIRKDLTGQINITAQHVVYDLKGIPVAPYSATTAADAAAGIAQNAMVQTPFSIRSEKESNVPFNLMAPAPAWNILGGMEGSLIDTFGGEYDISGLDIVLKDRVGKDRGVVIQYGHNMRSLAKETQFDNYTGAVGFWAMQVDDTYSEIHTSVLSTGVTADYTNVLTVDLTQYFDEKPSVSDLETLLRTYITVNKIGVPAVNFDISFVDLSKTLEYGSLLDEQNVAFGDTVTIKFPYWFAADEGEYTLSARVTETKWDALNDRYESISLGDYKKTLSDTIVEHGRLLAASSDGRAKRADYIVDQGKKTVNGVTWYYQKFDGGQFIGYCSHSLSSSTSSNRKSATFTLPFTMASADYVVSLTGTTNSTLMSTFGVHDAYGNKTKTTTKFIVYATLFSASEHSIGVDCVVRGRWK